MLYLIGMVVLEWGRGIGKWLLGVAAVPLLFSACSDDRSTIAGAAGNASSSGTAGSSGNAVSSAMCHADPVRAPSASEPTALDPGRVARAAAVIGTCVPDDGVARNTDVLWSGQASSDQPYERFQMQLDCLANSACGCQAAANCLGYTVSKVATCVSGCNAGVFTACGDAFDLVVGYQTTMDCKTVGLRCDPTVGCVDRAPTACDETFVAGCNADGQPEYCDSGLVHHGATCADLGLDCVAGACSGRGAACPDAQGGPAFVRLQGTGCEGSTLTACVAGKLARIDCSERGPDFGCQHFSGAFFCGLAGECSPSGTSVLAPAPSCAGTVLEFCSAGRLEHVDCVELGFSGCTVDDLHGLHGCTPGLSP